MTLRICSECQRWWPPTGADRDPDALIGICTECGGEFQQTGRGRPRLTCTQACYVVRNVRIKAEIALEKRRSATTLSSAEATRLRLTP